MKNKILILYLLFITTLSVNSIKAQETIPTSGGEAFGSGGSASYSIGQIVYSTITGENGSLAQGVQQPFEISVVSAIEETEGINLCFIAYPNPTFDELKLIIADFDILNLSFQLFDITGKLLQNEKINSSQTIIDMRDHKQAKYLLKVIQENKEVKIFKIIKN